MVSSTNNGPAPSGYQYGGGEQLRQRSIIGGERGEKLFKIIVQIVLLSAGAVIPFFLYILHHFTYCKALIYIYLSNNTLHLSRYTFARYLLLLL